MAPPSSERHPGTDGDAPAAKRRSDRWLIFSWVGRSLLGRVASAELRGCVRLLVLGELLGLFSPRLARTRRRQRLSCAMQWVERHQTQTRDRERHRQQGCPCIGELSEAKVNEWSSQALHRVLTMWTSSSFVAPVRAAPLEHHSIASPLPLLCFPLTFEEARDWSIKIRIGTPCRVRLSETPAAEIRPRLRHRMSMSNKLSIRAHARRRQFTPFGSADVGEA